MRRMSLALACATVACQEPASRTTPVPVAAPSAPLSTLLSDPWAVAPGPSFGTPSFGARNARPAEAPLPPTIVGSGRIEREPIARRSGSGLVSAMHGSALAALALTEDGRLAVSSDVSGSVRLWPALDGTIEPVVVPLRATKALAVGRAGRELVIAGLDDAGQLELIRTSEAGTPRERLTVGVERGLLALHATSRGFVALRDDHAIAAFDLEGESRGVLVAEPGEHVVSLSTRHDRVLALIERDDAVYGRWVTHGESLRWGDRTRPLPLRADHVVLSPSGATVAGVATNEKSIAVVELASAKVVVRPLRRSERDQRLRALGFLADSVLAMTSAQERVEWWGRPDLEDSPFARDAIAIADGVLVADSVAGTLALAGTTGESAFLGYRTGMLSSLRPFDDGYLVTDSTSVIELDRDFHTRAVHELPRDPQAPRAWNGVIPVDATHVLATTYANGGNAVYLIDLPKRSATLVASRVYVSGFEPTTGLLALHRVGGGLDIARFDPVAGAFGPTAPIDVDTRGAVRPWLLDPALADGHVAAIVTDDGVETAQLTLLRFATERDDRWIEIASQREVKLGQAWWDTDGDPWSIVRRVLPRARRLRSPDGAYTAELAGQRITLRDARGRVRWTAATRGAHALAWTPRGELVAYGAGAALVDLATGAQTGAQCGWRFGRWELPPDGFGSAMQCHAR